MSENWWALASAVEVYPDLADPDLRHVGVVLARPHPTGWFISGHHRPGLGPEDVELFAEFARVRAYLLLSQGPKAETWLPGCGGQDRVAWAVAVESDGAELVPDAIPADWR